MRKSLILTVAVWLLGLSGLAQAYNLTFEPVSQTILQGDTAQVSLNLTLDATETLYGFDIDVNFEPTILEFVDGTYGSAFSTWALAPVDLVAVGVLNIIAYDDSFTGVSDGLFSLATFNFFGTTLGTSVLTAGGDLDLGNVDTTGLPVLDFVDATGSVNVVPEPSTWLLMVVGLLGLVGMKKKYHRE